MEKERFEKFKKLLNIKDYDPCLCGSGVKFKKCCKIHIQESYIPKSRYEELNQQYGKLDKFTVAGQNELKKFFDANECLYIGCKELSCKSHVIPKNKLKLLANSEGYMYQLTDGSVWENRRIGISKATTFLGWCEGHDSELFQLTDKNSFNGSTKWLDESGMKLLGRSYRFKQNQLRNIYSLIVINHFDKEDLARLHAYYRSYKARKEIYEDAFKKHQRRKNILQHYIFTIPRNEFLCVSNMFYLNMNLKGEYINKDDDMIKNMEGYAAQDYICLNVFPEKEHLYICFSTHIRPPVYLKTFFKELRRMYASDLEKFKTVINNILLFYNLYSVITEAQPIEDKNIDYREDFSEQFPIPAKHKLLDSNLVIFIK